MNKCVAVLIVRGACAALFTSVFVGAVQLQAQTINNVNVRLEGNSVFYRSLPDSVFARVKPDVPFDIVWTFESSVTIVTSALPMRLYSPDGSITQVTWNRPVEPVDMWADPNVFMINGGAFIIPGADGFDGTLPSTFFTGGATFPGSGGYGPTGPQDILVGNLTVSQEGVLCVDSAYPGAPGDWYFEASDGFQGGAFVQVKWGASVGAYPAEGFCFEVADCLICDVAGDANGDGEVNIGDVSYLLAWIFGGGPYPPCIRQADANGDGKNQVGDVVWLVGWIFGGGPAPVCGP